MTQFLIHFYLTLSLSFSFASIGLFLIFSFQTLDLLASMLALFFLQFAQSPVSFSSTWPFFLVQQLLFSFSLSFQLFCDSLALPSFYQLPKISLLHQSPLFLALTFLFLFSTSPFSVL